MDNGTTPVQTSSASIGGFVFRSAAAHLGGCFVERHCDDEVRASSAALGAALPAIAWPAVLDDAVPSTKTDR
jgi:hypothetical protein